MNNSHELDALFANLDPRWGAWTRGQRRAWLKDGPNFARARDYALHARGVGKISWRHFLDLYGLKEVFMPADKN